MTITRGDMGGLDFRFDSTYTSYYDFVIGANGSYILTVRYTGSKRVTLLDSFSPAIKTGFNQPNLITVIARGSSIDLYVNKQYLAHVNDNTSSAGSIDPVSFSTTYPTDVAFRNMQIWQL